MFKDKKAFIEYIIIICIAICITAWLILDLEKIKSVITTLFYVIRPFFIGFGIAYVLNRPITFLSTKLNIERKLSIFIVYLLVVILISVFVLTALPRIIQSAIVLLSDLTSYSEQMDSIIASVPIDFLQNQLADNINQITEALGQISTSLLENVYNILISITTTFFNIFMGIIISIYMLADKTKIKRIFKYIINSMLKSHRSEKLTVFFGNVNTIFSHFISGLIVEALIVGAIAFVGLSILQVRYALILAVIICFTNVIPYFGPFIGAIPAIVATVMYDPWKALFVAIFIIILQQIDGNFIGPKVMGNYIGLDPIWIILSITLGSAFAGLLGILLAIPTGAIIKILLSEYLQKQNEKNHPQKSEDKTVYPH